MINFVIIEELQLARSASEILPNKVIGFDINDKVTRLSVTRNINRKVCDFENL